MVWFDTLSVVRLGDARYGLVYKMLCGNHPTFDLTIISQMYIYVVIQRTKKPTPLVQMGCLSISNDLEIVRS